MFRIQDNVPSVYINESRDFQLLCRLYDTLFSGVKYDIDTIVNVIDAMQCNDNMLEFLATKVGFFPRIHIDSNVLKYIVSGFPKMIKNKGNIDGITAAVQAVLKAESKYENSTVTIEFDNTYGDETEDKEPLFGTIIIYVNLSDYNKRALKEVLRYVVPFGFRYEVKFGYSIASLKDLRDTYTSRDGMTSIITLKTASSQVRTSEYANAYNNPFSRLLNAYSMGEVITNSITNDSYLNAKGSEYNSEVEYYTYDSSNNSYNLANNVQQSGIDSGDYYIKLAPLNATYSIVSDADVTKVITNDGGDGAPTGTKYNRDIVSEQES